MVHGSVAPDGVDLDGFRTAVDAASAGGHDVTAVDLLAEGFRPVMTAEEHRAYSTGSPIVSDEVRRHAAMLVGVEAMVFVYATTLTTVPPVLKGWFERVFVPGVGFVLDERTNKVRPGMAGVRRIVGIATHEEGRWAVRRAGDNGRRTILRALRMNTGIRTRTGWVALYGAGSATPSDRARFLRQIERRMARL